MKAFLILVFLVILSATACQKKEMRVSNKPDWVISEDSMVQILVDLRIADAAVYTNNKSFPRDKKKDFEFIYKKHHTNDSIFRLSHDYYAEHPEVAENIYERVIDELSEMVANNTEGQ